MWKGPELADQGPERRYSDRPKVTREGAEDETLGSAIDRAADHVGISWAKSSGGAANGLSALVNWTKKLHCRNISQIDYWATCRGHDYPEFCV